ncbi:MAG: NUDIX domain-containing protein [Bacteroidota bacterium]
MKIYFGDKPLYLTNEITEELQEILHHPDAVLVDEISSNAINAMLHEIKKEEFHAGVLVHDDLKALKKSLFKHFTLIEAAGGIVKNEEGAILFIYRLNKWDLPKGKIEDNEKEDECALREVEEETGVKKLSLKEKIGETYHTYDAFGKHFLKTTHWFSMSCPSDQKLKAQVEEHITEIKWVLPDDVFKALKNTYPSISDILDIYLDKE